MSCGPVLSPSAGTAIAARMTVAAKPVYTAWRVTQLPPSTRCDHPRTRKAGAGKRSQSIRRPSSTSAAGITTTAPPVANMAHVSMPVPTEISSCVGPTTATIASATMSAVEELLAVEPVQDQQREGDRDCESGHGSERDADGIELYHLAEEGDLPEPGQHAHCADRGHENRGDGCAQADQQQQEDDPDRDQLGATEVIRRC